MLHFPGNSATELQAHQKLQGQDEDNAVYGPAASNDCKPQQTKSQISPVAELNGRHGSVVAEPQRRNSNALHLAAGQD